MSFDQIVLAWNDGKVRKGIPVSSPESVLRAQEAMLWEMRNG